MKVFKGFEYRRGTTVMHRIDPRSKMIYLILFTFLTVYFSNIFVLLIIFASSLPIVFIGKITNKWKQSMRGTLFFLLFIFVLNFVLSYYFMPGVTLLSAILSAAALSIRFVALISIFSSFFLTTSPEDLTQSMVQLKIPYDYALTFNMAMRFVPTLSREAQYIMDAQKSRGLEMEKGSLLTKIKNYIPILIPLIISSFRRAELVADAMESRAFGASKKRTSLYVLKMGVRDYVFISIVLVSFILILLLRFIYGIQ